jgi:ABC-type Fe3+ transport system permease subunit
VLALPFALQSLEIPLAGLSSAARDTARTLGATSMGAFLDADLPRVRDGLVTVGLFAFAFGLGEFTATNFLVPPQLTTLPVAVYALSEVRLFPVADAAAGVGDVAGVARDNVEVKLGNRLAGSRAIV